IGDVGTRGMSEVGEQKAKKDREREVFAKFCETAGIDLVPNTLRQPDPQPHDMPDIEVEVVDQGPMRYELVNLKDHRELRGARLSDESDALMQSCWEKLAQLEREHLQNHFRDAQILVGFAGPDGGKQ